MAGAAVMVFVSGWAGIVLGGTAAWVYLVRRRRDPRARLVLDLLLWAAASSVATIVLVRLAPGAAAEHVPNGAAYWDEMAAWVRTGAGRESTPSAFVPQHLLHLGAFLVLAAATGGWAGLVLGAFLLGYMSYYVAQVSLAATEPALAALLAWHPWSLCRVAGFVILGVAVSRLLLDRLPPARWFGEERRALVVGLALIAADLALKAVLAPYWPALLRSI